MHTSAYFIIEMIIKVLNLGLRALDFDSLVNLSMVKIAHYYMSVLDR